MPFTKAARVSQLLGVAVLALVLPACSTQPATDGHVESPAGTAPTTATEVADTSTTTTDPIPTIDYVEYVDTALSVMERRFYDGDRVDWEAVRLAVSGLPESPSPAQAYIAIQEALQELGDPHSSFLRPHVVDDLATFAGQTLIPTGERIDSVGNLNLPSVSPRSIDPDNPRHYADTVNELLSSLDQPEPACGWTIDLRENGGGTIGPIFASLGPLLGEGIVLTATGPVGTQVITVGDDLMISYGFEAGTDDRLEEFPLLTPTASEHVAVGVAASSPSEPPHRLGVEELPVALLISELTASAAEYVTVAFVGRDDTRTFGNVTAGVPTGIDAFEFVDGGVLRLAALVPADRQGTSYETHILLDELIPFSAPDEDRPLDAALEWLTNHPSCR